MTQVRGRLPGRLVVGGALALSSTLPACWVVVGGEDKVLVDEDLGRAGRAGKPSTQGGQGGALGEGGSGMGAGAAGAPNAGGSGAGGGGGGAGTSAGGANAGSGGAGGAAGASSGGGGAGATAGGAGGGASGAAGLGGTGAGGATVGGTGGASATGGAAGGAGKAGGGQGGQTAGAGGASGSAGKGGSGGSGGASDVQTGPGQFDCTKQPFLGSYPFCTNFSPPPMKWDGLGCNSRPIDGGNTTILWAGATNSKCTAFFSATAPVSPTNATVSLWVRVKEIGVAAAEPGLDFAAISAGTHPGVSIGVRQTRSALGVITGNILVLRSAALTGGTLDVGAFPLDIWHHVSVSLGFKAGKCTVGGGYGLTSADELASQTVDTTTDGATGAVKLEISFRQTEFLAGPTSVEMDDVYLH